MNAPGSDVALPSDTQIDPNSAVIVIQGPTASGKTAVACELAVRMPLQLISADSRQIYRYMDIGTAKPTAAELETFPHACINIRNPDESYSAGVFAADAHAAIAAARRAGRTPVIVGGSGLYIRAACHGLFDDGGTNDAIRAALQSELQERGIDALFTELESVDPDAAARYQDRNPRRILRALEYARTHGRPLTQAQADGKTPSDLQCLFFQIDQPRSELYERINQRTKKMFDQGLVAECEALLQRGYNAAHNALNTVGYKEVLAHLAGDISLERAAELCAQKTRNYAKRQLTWFRRADPRKLLTGSVQEIADSIAVDYIRRSSSPDHGV